LHSLWLGEITIGHRQALSDLDILLRLKLPDGDLRQGRLQDIVNAYQ
jgi:hypothetical protein